MSEPRQSRDRVLAVYPEAQLIGNGFMEYRIAIDDGDSFTALSMWFEYEASAWDDAWKRIEASRTPVSAEPEKQHRFQNDGARLRGSNVEEHWVCGNPRCQLPEDNPIHEVPAVSADPEKLMTCLNASDQSAADAGCTCERRSPYYEFSGHALGCPLLVASPAASGEAQEELCRYTGKPLVECACPDGCETNQVESDEWVQPIESGYVMRCCGCDLAHEMDFRIHEGKIQFRARRAPVPAGETSVEGGQDGE